MDALASISTRVTTQTERARADQVVNYAGGYVFPVSDKARQMPFSRTDCAVPMLWAAKHDVPVDTFITMTDSETWAGSIQPFQAVRQYREKTGIPARSVVVAFTSTGFSIADPLDAGMLDCVGFDTSTPQVLTEFSAGRL